MRSPLSVICADARRLANADARSDARSLLTLRYRYRFASRKRFTRFAIEQYHPTFKVLTPLASDTC